MEKAIQEITATPSKTDLNDHELAGECSHLKQSIFNKLSAATLASDINGTNTLDLLNPNVNTLGFVFVLYVSEASWSSVTFAEARFSDSELSSCAKIDVSAGKAINANIEHIKNLLENYDPRQTKHAAIEFRRVVDKTVEYCSAAGNVSPNPLSIDVPRL